MYKYLFLIAIILSLYFNACSKKDRNSTLNENNTSKTDTKYDNSGIQAALDNMMKNLHAQKTTGNPDVDFTKLITIHQQGAIDISDAYLKTANDSQIKSIAEQEIRKNKSDINDLNMWRTAYKDSAVFFGGDNYKDRMDENMTEMMKHTEFIRSSNSDINFAVVMVPHHRDAIEIAKVEIDFGRDEKLKAIAKNMIKDLQEQIRVMEEWMANQEK